jgi:hypothetical protein
LELWENGQAVNKDIADFCFDASGQIPSRYHYTYSRRKKKLKPMTIQPLSSRPREISVTEIIEPAYERVKLILFRPFDLTKWIVIGFCA